jgi:glycine/D-amino acid oxidase-like deaminating enzyme
MSAQAESLWTLPDPIAGPALAENADCDVCIIGAGIAGLTSGYLLAREGKRVRILDAKPHILEGETHFTTAHLTWVIDDRFSHLATG